MNTVNSGDWPLLLSTQRNVRLIKNWCDGKISSGDVSDALSGTKYAGSFRHVLRQYKTGYGRRLARKALKYRSL